MKIELVYGDAQQQTLLALDVASPSCVAEVLQRYLPEKMAMADLMVGIFGQPVSVQQLLQAGDRIEIYRPLRLDPKTARRLVAKAERKSVKPSRRSKLQLNA